MHNKKLLFASDSNVPQSGYGGVYQNFIIALLKKGVDLIGFDKSVKPDVHIFLGQPEEKRRNAWQRKAEAFGLFTMFEAELLPQNWVQTINEHFDFCIVPSVWCRNIFLKGGLKKPVFIVPLGVNPEMFPYLKRPERKEFNILWQGFHDKDRKGFNLVEMAFTELQLPNARLIKKISPYSLMTPAQFEIRGDRATFCTNMSRAELLLFLRDADLSVNPTAGEGFGLIPLEHMATGLPVLVSRNSGCLEYADPDYSIGISCKRGPSWFGEGFGDMDIPDYEDVKAKIKWAYENREGMKEIGLRASRWVRQEWTYDKAAHKLLEVVDEFIS